MAINKSKGLHVQPVGTASIILKLHIQNKRNNREIEKIMNSDVKNILKG
jgi:hypothetical protein